MNARDHSFDGQYVRRNRIFSFNIHVIVWEKHNAHTIPLDIFQEW